MIRKRFAELQVIGYNNLNVKRQNEYNQLAAALYTTEGGRFAEHTRKAPVWIDNRDPSRSRNRNAYVYGNWTQENTAARLASGRNTLEFVSGEGRGDGFKAQTTQKGKDRLIEMKDSGNKYENAVLLGHEAYRDGIVSDSVTQSQETIDAVIGHAGMTSRMRDDAIVFDGALGKEVEAYRNGNIAELMLGALDNYKSDGDYWMVTKDKDGRIIKIENDGSNDITFVDEEGN